jgi:hypothetical protein
MGQAIPNLYQKQRSGIIINSGCKGFPDLSGC